MQTRCGHRRVIDTDGLGAEYMPECQRRPATNTTINAIACAPEGSLPLSSEQWVPHRCRWLATVCRPNARHLTLENNHRLPISCFLCLHTQQRATEGHLLLLLSSHARTHPLPLQAHTECSCSSASMVGGAQRLAGPMRPGIAL